MKKPKIGIIGHGFVGKAVSYGFSDQTGFSAEIRIYDKDKSKSLNSIEETVNESDFLFISVPTPAQKNGEIDLSIIKAVLIDIDKANKNTSNIILIRSTILPGTTRMLQEKFSRLNLVFNPEFLTERSANFDFINQSRIILGGEIDNTRKVERLYKQRFGAHQNVLKTNFQTAELIKYMNNLFFATKVSFLNEMKLIADKNDVDWDLAVQGFVLDGRIGHSHLQVPGPDGKPGFGGSCFPKDIQAMIAFGKQIGINMNTIDGAWKTNLELRPEKDWENLVGRAISGEE